jgi:hypothetical protein
VFEGLSMAARLFYEYYLDEYDFLIVVTDHLVENATAFAAFDAVHRPAQLATGDRSTEDLRFAHGSERLLGVVACNGGESSPPLEHELAHYWANHLDPSLGFGVDATQNYGSHWGMTSVHGQLGGFDENAFFCVDPPDAVPPNCTPESDGTMLFRFGPFAPHVNRSADYAPLELYLMGLVPKEEVQDRFLVVEGAAFSETVVDPDTGDYLIAGAGVGEIQFSDVVALHGEVPLKPEEDRHYRAAFVVVSESPASEEQLAFVSEWQETFGNHVGATGTLRSFEERTGNRATLSTRLGRRRTADDPVPDPPMPAVCSVTLQDCPDDLGCYGSADRLCGIPGTLEEGDPCERNDDCLPGFACPTSLRACAPYCDPFDESAAKACTTWCPGAYTRLLDGEGELTGGYCSPE